MDSHDCFNPAQHTIKIPMAVKRNPASRVLISFSKGSPTCAQPVVKKSEEKSVSVSKAKVYHDSRSSKSTLSSSFIVFANKLIPIIVIKKPIHAREAPPTQQKRFISIRFFSLFR